MKRWFKILGGSSWVAALVTALALLTAPAAQAAHLNVSCASSDLSDLQAAITANFGSGKGGVRWDSTTADPFPAVEYGDMKSGSTSKNGCYFQDRFDMLQGYLLFDFLDADGRYHGNTNVYAAWEIAGVVGDDDGDNNVNANVNFFNIAQNCNQQVIDVAGNSSDDHYTLRLI